MELLYKLENKEMNRNRVTFLHETELLCFLIASYDVFKLLHFYSKEFGESQIANPLFSLPLKASLP